MALQRDARYPGRWTAASAGHPQGAFKNRTAPGSLDGSYIEQDWANDWDGYFSSMLNAAGLTANGTVDAVGASQYYTALTTVIKAQAAGRLLRTTVYAIIAGTQQVSVNGGAFTSAGATTFSTQTLTSEWHYKIIGGAGAGGGAQGTTAGQQSVGGGGGAGGVAEGIGLTVLSGVAVAIGVGGAPGAAGLTPGGNGGTSSIATVASATGGTGGGGAGGALSTFPGVISGGVAGIGSGANLINARGVAGGIGFNNASANVASGNGGASILGGGGQAVGGTGSGSASNTYGAGGSGGVCFASVAGGAAGGAGGAGYIEIKEYV